MALPFVSVPPPPTGCDLLDADFIFRRLPSERQNAREMWGIGPPPRPSVDPSYLDSG